MTLMLSALSTLIVSYARFRLKDHPEHLDPASMAAFMHSFSETDKLAYHGTAEDDGE